jgi:hypothetical protein
MGSFGKQKGEARGGLETRIFPGAFGQPEAQRLARSLEDLLGAPTPTAGFRPQSAAQQQLIRDLTEQVSGQAAVRGLGRPTGASVAQAIAPTLVGFQQAQQQADLARRAQTIQGLLELTGLALPQIVGGQTTRERQRGFQLGVAAPTGG